MKTVLITGSNSGIGLTTSVYLANKGFFVYATMRDLKKKPKIFDKFSNIKVLRLDVTNEKSIRNCVLSIIKEKKQIDFLINNAGYGLWGAFEDLKIKDIKEMFDTNLFGVINLTNYILPYMRKQKVGRIINISSISGLIPFPVSGAYSSSKHALESYSESLQLETAHFGIKVIIIEPGLINTRFRYNLKNRMAKNSPYKSIYDYVIKKYLKPSGSSPLRVAKVIHKAMTIKRPRLRYLIGNSSRLNTLVKKVLPDRIFGLIVGYILKSYKQKLYKPN